MVAKAFAMIGFIRRYWLEFRDLYTLKSLYIHVSGLSKYGIRMRGLGWTDMHDLPPYEDRCVLLYLNILTKSSPIQLFTNFQRSLCIAMLLCIMLFNGQYAQWTFLFAASTHFRDKIKSLLFNFVFYFLFFCFLCIRN
jgi:hypothetical protein